MAKKLIPVNDPDDNSALQKHVDEMMDLEKPVQDDVSKLAENFNKEFLSGKPEVKPKDLKTAPALPAELKVEDKEAVVEEPALETESRAEEAAPAELKTDKLDDEATDEAVEDIVSKEGDVALAVEDAKRAKLSRDLKPKTGWRQKLKAIFKDKRAWMAIGLLLVILLAVPATRYKLLGLAVKKSVTISVVDSKTATPVSGADVRLGGGSAKTDGEGRATVRAGVGSRQLKIGKSYYKSLTQAYFVGFKSTNSKYKLTATGRLVPITVTNKITGKPLKNAQVSVLGTTAKTNSRGLATIALPTKTATNPAKLGLGGYNSADITVTVTDQAVKANHFELTPAGHIYFLSNRSGKLDVIKANLDGSGRKTVLEGTGREEARSTSLLASRDWRYLVLKSRREGDKEALYLIDAATDKVTPFDTSGADYALIGWYDHSLVYALTKSDNPEWQAGRQAIKSYDAGNQQLNQLDQNQAEGDASRHAYQSFYNFYIVKGAVVYDTQWYTYAADGSAYDLNGKSDTIRAVGPTGQNKKDYQSFASGSVGYAQASLYEPNEIYFAAYDKSANKTNYYEYQNQAVKIADIDQSDFDKSYPTYLLSPSGGQTFWGEPRDGKNSLFIGDANADSKKQIAPLSGYSPYGWYGDNYVLVSKGSSELYISTPAAMTANRAPLKVTDYYKPAIDYSGYGYGYGGL